MTGVYLCMCLLFMSMTEIPARLFGSRSGSYDVTTVRNEIVTLKTQFQQNNLPTTGLDEINNQLQTLTSDLSVGKNYKVTTLGKSVSGAIDFMKELQNGDFYGVGGGKRAALSVVKLAGQFADVGGAFLPPPFGSAISGAFGIINSLMSLIGGVGKGPSIELVMEELIDEQTKKIQKMFDNLNNHLWKEIVNEGHGLTAEFTTLHGFFRTFIKHKNHLNLHEIQMADSKFDITKGKMFLSKLRNLLEEHCKMKTKQNEKRCLVLLECFSRISMMRQMQIEMMTEITEHEKTRYIRLAYEETQKKENIDMKRKLELLILPAQKYNSLSCLRTIISKSSPNEFIATKTAMARFKLKIELTKYEEDAKDRVCPSSNTKLMLIAGVDENSWRSVDLVSPFKTCPRKDVPTRANYFVGKPGAALYTANGGEERVMVCGSYSQKPSITKSVECWSTSGKDWRLAAFIPHRKGYYANDIKSLLSMTSVFKNCQKPRGVRQDYTIYGKKCGNSCGYNGGYSYQWCIKAPYMPQVARGVTVRDNMWDYCSRYPQTTQYDQPCKGSCTRQSKAYYWCWRKTSGWDYCSPPATYTNNLSNKNCSTIYTFGGNMQIRPSFYGGEDVPTIRAWQEGDNGVGQWYTAPYNDRFKNIKGFMCTVTYKNTIYTLGKYGSFYAEVDQTDIPSSMSRGADGLKWKNLPSSNAHTWRPYTCTVAIVEGRAALVKSWTEKESYVEYLPLPYTSVWWTPNAGVWRSLPKIPNSGDCNAGLGWADGKLVCASKGGKDDLNWWLNGDESNATYYYDEHENKWILADTKRKKRKGNAYVTVPGDSFGCN